MGITICFSSEDFTAKYLTFIITPPSEQDKFLRCKEILRYSITVPKSELIAGLR